MKKRECDTSNKSYIKKFTSNLLSSHHGAKSLQYFIPNDASHAKTIPSDASNVNTIKAIHTSKPIDPKALSADSKANLVNQLYHIHCQIFDGVDRDQFCRYVVDPPTLSTRIRFFRNTNGENVGYITTQIFETKVQKDGYVTKPLVYRTEVGILPEYRGNNIVLRTLLWDCLRGYVRSAKRESWFLATPIHPNPYCVAAKQMYEMYPKPGIDTPQHVKDMMEELSHSLGLEPTGNSTLQRKVGWIVKNRPERRCQPEQSTNPFVQYYLQQNPTFREGTGMMMVIPFGWMNISWSMGNMIWRSFKNGIQSGQQ